MSTANFDMKQKKMLASDWFQNDIPSITPQKNQVHAKEGDPVRLMFNDIIVIIEDAHTLCVFMGYP